jgi:uncharacterized membrane protein YfcA
LNPLDQVLLFFISLAANALSAMAGGGAGLIQLPALIFLGLPFAVALVTHKIASVALGIGATLRHLKEGNTEWKFSLFVLACGLPGVLVGASLILQIPDRVAEIALGVLTAALGLYSWSRSGFGQRFEKLHRNFRGYVVGGGTLFVLGILNGSLTSGTGLFVTIWLIRWFGLDYKRAVACTLILVGLFWNGTGALALTWLGEVQWDWLPALILGSLLGGYAGAHLAIVRGNRLIKRVFEWVTVVIGIKLVIG